MPTASLVAALAWDTLTLRNLQWSSLPKAPNEILMSMKLLWSLILLDKCHLPHTIVGAQELCSALRQAAACSLVYGTLLGQPFTAVVQHLKGAVCIHWQNEAPSGLGSSPAGICGLQRWPAVFPVLSSCCFGSCVANEGTPRQDGGNAVPLSHSLLWHCEVGGCSGWSEYMGQTSELITTALM